MFATSPHLCLIYGTETLSTGDHLSLPFLGSGFLDTSDEWSPTVIALLFLGCFTQHSVSKVHP